MYEMKKLLIAAAAFAACICVSADAPRSFAATVEDYLATHPVAGMETYADFCRLVAQPAANGAVDATVQPCHKARKIRFWGALEHMPVFKSWGLDVEEFDPDAADRGDYPDVIFCHLSPGYCQGDVDQILDAVRHGTHFVTLQTTDRWSEVIAKRLGHTYGGVLTAPAMDRGGVFFKNCPKLFDGFPEGRLDAPLFSCVGKSRHGMFLTGETCLLGVADTHTGRIASSIAQYKYGKGAVTLVGPCVNQSSTKDMNAPAYKRLLLNLVDLLPPVAREKPYDVLLYTRWMWHRDPKTGAVAPKGSYHHFSTEIGAGEMARYFTAKGLTVKVTDDPEVFRTAAFRACPRMVFACANEEQFETESQRAAFYAWAQLRGRQQGVARLPRRHVPLPLPEADASAFRGRRQVESRHRMHARRLRVASRGDLCERHGARRSQARSQVRRACNRRRHAEVDQGPRPRAGRRHPHSRMDEDLRKWARLLLRTRPQRG